MDFGTFIRVMARRWRIVVAAIVACVLGAVVVTALQTKTYRSTATVLMSVSGATTVTQLYEAAQTSQFQMSAYAEIAGGREVAQRAIDELHVPLSADELVDHTTVQYEKESTMFRLSVVDDDPPRAAALAEAMAGQFAQLVPTLTAPEGWVGAPAAKATVVEHAAVPAHAVSPVPVRNLVLGLVAGVLLAIALALTRDATDPRVREPATLERVSGLPTLATVPRMNSRGKRGESRFGAGTPSDEAMRGLRARLAGLATDPVRTLLVTGPAGGEGTTTTAVNLAMSFTELGEEVLLIEADPRQATIADRIGVQCEKGLADVLEHFDLIEYARRPTHRPGLSVLASAEAPGTNPRLGTPALAELLDNLLDRFDRIVIDGPPALATADAGLLAGACESTVLVARAGRSTVDEVDSAVNNLRAAGGTIIGTVLVGAPMSRHTTAALRAYRAKLSLANAPIGQRNTLTSAA